ncbi:hypothetical protein [Sphingomonas sp. NFX23]|uniref:hypothetical protein n=1 Tax=Sphingomonas sp. NFX23 TaxID=2819532 RepID=UPI003CE9D5DF
MWGRFTTAALAGLMLNGLAACSDGRFPDYRYRITIYAQGEAYSSVRQIRQREIFSMQDSSGRKVETSMNGQAVIMDLPDGRKVYATLVGKDSPEQAKYIPRVALLPKGYKRPNLPNMLDGISAEQKAIIGTVGSRDLPRTVTYNPLHREDYSPEITWPLFASFDDPSDWTTIHTVDPEDIGVNRITIEITDEPVTTGIEAVITKPGNGPRFKQWQRSLKVHDDRISIIGAFFERDAK